MSPTSGMVFGGETPDYVGEAYSAEPAATTGEAGAAAAGEEEAHDDGIEVESLPNSDVLSELAKISSRLDTIERNNRQYELSPGAARGTPLRQVYGGAQYGYATPQTTHPQLTPGAQLRMNDLGANGHGGYQTSAYFTRRSGVYGPGAQDWNAQLQARFRQEYEQQIARDRDQLRLQYENEFNQQYQGMQQRFDSAVRRDAQHLGGQGVDQLRAELTRAQEAIRVLHEQLRQRATGAPMSHDDVGFLDPNHVRVPTASQGKINSEPFDGSEVYKGLGAGFVQWGRQFLVKIDLAEQACGFRWPEVYKVSRLGEFMRGKASRYFHHRIDSWWNVTPTLGYVMDRMMDAYKIVFSRKQVIKLFSEPKERGRSWNDHLLYLVALQEATNGGDELILENIVKHAVPSAQVLMMGKYNQNRVDYLKHAEELVTFVQALEDESVMDPRTGREIVNAITETRTCYNCGQVGHISRDCSAARRGGAHSAGKGSPRLGGGDGTRNVRWALSASVGELAEDDWILDTGASCHLVRDASMLVDAVLCSAEDDCVQPDGSRLQVTHRGTTMVSTLVDGEVVEIALSGAVFAPRLSRNLVSYGRLVAKGCVLTQVNGRHAVTKDGSVVFYVTLKNHVLVIDRVMGGPPSQTFEEIIMSAVAAESVEQKPQQGTLMDFHRRFGHLNFDTIERLAKDPGSGIELTDHKQLHCLTCAQGKQTRAVQPTVDTGASSPTDRIGGVICSDLKGPITPRDRGGNRYLVNFVDHKTNYCRVFLAPTKDKAAKKFEHFLVYFEKRFNCRIHVLRTDGGGEYANVDLFCRESGVARQITEAGNQAGNGKAERMHRTVFNMVRCMVFACGLPLSFWGDAAEYASYILNRMPTRSNPSRKSPLEMLEGKPPSLSDIVVFGSPCEVFRDPKKKTLKQRSVSGLIVGKSDETKGFRVYIPSDKVVITTRHIQRVETLTDAANAELRRILEDEAEDDLEELARSRQQERALQEEARARREGGETKTDTEDEPRNTRSTSQGTARQEDAPRRSTRAKKKSLRRSEADGDDEEELRAPRGLVNAIVNAVRGGDGGVSEETVNAVVDAVKQVFQAEFAHLPDPKNYKEAIRSPDRALWLRAHIEELQSLRANKTWKIVRAVSGMMRLHTKWVHKKKKHGDGTIERYKARLVACGNEQVLGVNFLLTFAAVLDLTSGKAILAFARIWRTPARHFDVPSAYVKAAKEDGVDIYLYIPDGMEFTAEELAEFGVESASELALCLERSLYGLKQAGRLWHQLLHNTLINIGFVQCITDTCLYYKIDEDGTTLVGTYVDDLLVTGTSDARVDDFFSQMGSLELKDLGRAEKFLGMRIQYDDADGYKLDQEHTIRELLEKNGLGKSNASATRCPMGDEQTTDSADGGAALLPTSGPGTPEHPTVKSFQSLVGSLLWVARCTRPDISFAVHRASRRSHAPTVGDYKLAKRIARYLAGTAELKLAMIDDGQTRLPLRIDCFTDADFAGDKVDRKSVSGGIMRINGMVVGWHCRKQDAVALSTAEAEYVAASMGGKEVLGLKELAGELGLAVSLPMSMLMDNQAAMKQVENEASSAQAKHVDVRLKFLTDYSKKGVIKPKYVPTQDMQADLLTKALPAPRIMELRAAVGLV